MPATPQVMLPDQICPLCAVDPACTERHREGPIWSVHCHHDNVGAILLLAEGQAPRWLTVPNVTRAEWDLLLTLTASTVQRVAGDAAAAVAAAAKH